MNLKIRFLGPGRPEFTPPEIRISGSQKEECQSFLNGGNTNKQVFDNQKKTATGVQCPKCRGELHDNSFGIVLLSYPAQINVKCKECGHETRMFVNYKQ